jgi:pimeloyl-ACP methyl ester carboxylesterase
VSLRYELGPDHEYEYLQATLPAPLAEELKPYYPSSTQTFNYADSKDPISVRQALEQLHTFIQLEGPFDGVIAYSLGAGFAATYIIQQASAPLPVSPFKCAIFFSAARPVDPGSLSGGVVRLMDPDVDGIRIHIPTAHIWGSNDTLHPGTSQFVRGLSDPMLREEVVHQEGHDIPGGKARSSVLEIAKAIRRTVARAEGWNGR